LKPSFETLTKWPVTFHEEGMVFPETLLMLACMCFLKTPNFEFPNASIGDLNI